MKKYKITVNGQSYEVEVEEIGKENISTEDTTPTSEPPKTASQPKKAPKAPKKAVTAGAGKVTCPMPGTIISIKAKEGDKIFKGDVIMILEAMKMENEIQAPQDCVITSINVAEGASVNTGDILATFN